MIANRRTGEAMVCDSTGGKWYGRLLEVIAISVVVVEGSRFELLLSLIGGR